MTVICLTHGRYALIDDEDWERINQWKWCANYSKLARAYRAMRSAFDKATGKTPTILMSRFIMGAAKGTIVDHKDRDTLNNQKGNLRVCTPVQSLANRGMPRNNTSGFKGVTLIKKTQKWTAHATVKHLGAKNLGNFSSKEEAAKAYDEYVTAHNGEFAVTNKSLGLL